MEKSKTRTFLSDWGFQLVLVAIALPILGLAFLIWSMVPVSGAGTASSAPAEQEQRSATDVIGAFRAAGLRADVVRGESKDERDGFSGFMVVDAKRFRVSEKANEMGMVLRFENIRDLKRMQQYFLGLNDSLPQFRSRLYVRDNILLQMNYEVPESTALEYAAVLDGLDQ